MGCCSFITDPISNAVDSVSDAVSSAVDTVSDAISSAADSIQDSYDNLTDSLQDSYDSAVDQLQEWQDDIKDTWAYDAYDNMIDHSTGVIVGTTQGVIVGTTTGGVIGGLTGGVIGGITGGVAGEDVMSDLTVDELVGIATGEEAEDRADIIHTGEELESLTEEYEERMAEFEDQAANKFMLPEIFQMALTNKAERYSDDAIENIELLQEEYQLLIDQYGEDYAVLTQLQDGTWAAELLAGLGMIASGLNNDVNSIVSGDASRDEWKRLMTTVVAIIAIIVLFVYATPIATYAAYAAIAALLVSLDGMYANNTLTGGILGFFDMLYNDILHIDSVWEKSGYLDKDSEHYQEQVMYFQISVALQAMITGLFVSTNAENPNKVLDSYNAIKNTKAAGALSDLYAAYQVYELVDDTVQANEALKELEKELETYKLEVDARARTARNRKMLKSFREADYLLAGPMDVTEIMMLQCAEDPLTVGNPEASVFIANATLSCKSDADFGFEEAFNLNFIN